MLLFIYGFYCKSELILLQIVAIAFGIWSLAQFKSDHFAVGPEPKEDARLITKGPYAIVRNPIYLCLLIYFSAFLIEDFNWFGLNFFVLLTITLILKLNLEEALLKIKFPAYSEYAESTKKLIPYLY